MKNIKIKSKRRIRGEQSIPNQKQELSMIERTTRLVLVLTVLGGSFGFLGKYYFSFFKDYFESSIYLAMYIRTYHILLISIGAYISISIFYILCYIVAEFKSLNVMKHKSIINQTQFNIANQKYEDILKGITTNFFIGLTMVSLFGIIQLLYLKDKLFIGILGIILLLILIVFIVIVKKFGFRNINWLSKVKFVFKKFPFEKTWIFIVVSTLWFMLGIMFMISPTVVNINFKNEELNINSSFGAPKDVTITFVHEQSGDETVIKTLTLKEKDFKVAYQQTLSSPNVDHDFIVKLRGLAPNTNTSLDMRNTTENFEYNVNYKNYLKNGQNYVIISFSTESLETKISKIVNPIFYKNGKLDIQKSDFIVK